MNPTRLVPPTKWVGSKRHLASTIVDWFPPLSEIKRYVEPMVGMGAVLVELLNRGWRGEVVLGDKNPEVVNLWRVIKDVPEALIDQAQGLPVDKVSFHKIRALDACSGAAGAARFLYITRTGFNGLIRYNKAGRINTPWGAKEPDLKVVHEDEIRALSQALNECREIRFNSGDFQGIVAHLGIEAPDTVSYWDPPFFPLTQTADFTAYNSGGFGLDDQKRLATVFHKLAKISPNHFLSNSYCEDTLQLYAGLERKDVSAPRAVNSDGTGRGTVKELLVRSKLLG